MVLPRARICLNGLWERSEEGTAERAPDTGWRSVRVPEEFADWSRETAWYRLRFLVPKEWAGQRLEIEIGRIRFSGAAYLNGRCCGQSWQPRLPLQADLTEYVRFGAENELLVLARALTATSLPLSDLAARTALLDYADTADMAGIFGDVVLTCRPLVAITDVFITPSVRQGGLQVQATVRNDTPKEQSAQLSWMSMSNGNETPLTAL